MKAGSMLRWYGNFFMVQRFWVQGFKGFDPESTELIDGWFQDHDSSSKSFNTTNNLFHISSNLWNL
jgi:hypothetical protein